MKLKLSIDEEVEAIIKERNIKRFVEPSERCGYPHAGSSTCAGCDDRCFILTKEEAARERFVVKQNIIDQYKAELEILNQTIQDIENKLKVD